MPVSQHYRPDPLFVGLGAEFADIVAPAQFPQHIERWRNQDWSRRVGLDALDANEREAHFARFQPLPDNMTAPLAMRYHGHQFRTYNPDIGDGRGFLFAQLRDDSGRLLDLATKGSGKTPYSRFGDGRLTLKGGVREVLAAQMLEALGVYTSKAFSLFETGEALVRGDEPSPTRSSVLVRLSHSHIRFGTFQRLAYIERPDLIHQLIEHVVDAYYPQLSDLSGEQRAVTLFGEIVEANARLTASWMAAGFVHGVLNTDNLNVTGESFDYGPWRFLPVSDPHFTAAYFDQSGLYSFGRQPEAVMWALVQLGSAMTLVAPASDLERELGRFPAKYQEALRERMFARLKLEPRSLDEDLHFLNLLFDWLTTSGAGWDQFFHDWVGGGVSAQRAAASPQAYHYEQSAFADVRRELDLRSRDSVTWHDYYSRVTPVHLVIDEVEALWSPIAERNDWSLFAAKIADIELLKHALAAHCH